MLWLSSPKVRLALIVNGLYFFSIFTPTPPHTRPRFFAHARESRGGDRASASESGRLLHISPNNDLILVERPGRKLLLSPWFNASRLQPTEPKSIHLDFILFTTSSEASCPDNCPLTIKADDEVLWPKRSAIDSGDHSYSWKRGSVPPSSSRLEDGSLVETMAAESFSAEVPYDTFLDIISARRVVVRLGPDWVELTNDQIEVLRDMHRRLPPLDDSNSD